VIDNIKPLRYLWSSVMSIWWRYDASTAFNPPRLDGEQEDGDTSPVLTSASNDKNPKYRVGVSSLNDGVMLKERMGMCAKS